MSSEERVLGVISQFEELKQSRGLGAAAQFLRGSEQVHRDVTEAVQPQDSSGKVFQWLYGCATCKKQCPELYGFVLWFVPDVILVYLQSVYEAKQQLKGSSEALLMCVIMEAEKGRHVSACQVPSVSKPSIYHQPVEQHSSQQSLTEAALQRHDLTHSPQHHTSKAVFSGKEISVNNRLSFLSAVVDVFVEHLLTFPPSSLSQFCHFCVKLALSGMGDVLSREPTIKDLIAASRGESVARRFSMNDQFITSLLHGIKICLFQSCSDAARQALLALKFRAEYDLLTGAMQVSHALMRLTDGVRPEPQQLNMEDHCSYVGRGEPTFCVDPSAVHCSINSHVLHTKLYPLPFKNTEQPSVAKGSPSKRKKTSLGQKEASISPHSKSTAV